MFLENEPANNNPQSPDEAPAPVEIRAGTGPDDQDVFFVLYREAGPYSIEIIVGDGLELGFACGDANGTATGDCPAYSDGAVIGAGTLVLRGQFTPDASSNRSGILLVFVNSEDGATGPITIRAR